MGTGGPFPGGKARPGRDAHHSHPCSAEVKNEQELYLLSPHAPPWRVAGSLKKITFLKIKNYEAPIIQDLSHEKITRDFELQKAGVFIGRVH
jgi:hypothetical protein